jgi:hypothetical protein
MPDTARAKSALRLLGVLLRQDGRVGRMFIQRMLGARFLASVVRLARFSPRLSSLAPSFGLLPFRFARLPSRFSLPTLGLRGSAPGLELLLTHG